MASAQSSLSEASRLNIPVRLSGFVIGAMLPFALYFSTKSATIFVALAALLGLYGVWKAGLAHELAVGLTFGPSALNFIAALFLGYAAASVFWSQFPELVGWAYAEIVVSLLVSAGVALAYRVVLPYKFGFGIAIGLIAASVYAILEFRLGLKVRLALGHRNYAFVFNRSLVYQVMLLWPMILLIAPNQRWLAAVATVFLIVAAGVSESGAAVFGLIVGGLAMICANFASRVTLRLLSAGTVLYIAIAPWLGAFLQWLLPIAVQKKMGGAHAIERIGIWSAFGEFMQGNWLFGTGLGSTARALELPAAQNVSEHLRPMLGNNHPHNAFLQIWVELGAVGAMLMAATIVILLHRLDRLDRHQRICATGYAGAALAITAVSHGAWQAWWLTTVCVIAAIFWAAKEPDHVVA